MKQFKYIYTLLIASLLFMSGCKDKDIVNEHEFSNAVYVTSKAITDDLLIKPDLPTSSREITYRTAMPLKSEAKIHFDADPTLTAAYNLMYKDKAEALAEKYYNIPQKTATIKEGAISSENIVINFENTDELDNNKRYVLAVTITNSDIKVMEGKNTVYFVFKGAALINVVANIHYVYFPVEWQQDMSNLPIVTVEALVRSKDWTDGRGNALSTILGVEGGFLLRVGDGDRPRDQFQVAAPGGNFPPPHAVPGLPVNEWVHIAVVYNNISKERIFYKDGVKVYSDKSAAGNVNLYHAVTDNTDRYCFIGYSWGDGRYLPGEISEVRVWNLERTAKEIADNIYGVNPTAPGLLAYWKFNEGFGDAIADHSGNGNDIKAIPYNDGKVSWVEVELPAQEE